MALSNKNCACTRHCHGRCNADGIIHKHGMCIPVQPPFLLHKPVISNHKGNVQVPGFFWGPMLMAAVLGHLSRKQGTQTELQHLKRIKPDFNQNARILISLFVKEEPLVADILEGLQKAGLRIPSNAQ